MGVARGGQARILRRPWAEVALLGSEGSPSRREAGLQVGRAPAVDGRELGLSMRLRARWSQSGTEAERRTDAGRLHRTVTMSARGRTTEVEQRWVKQRRSHYSAAAGVMRRQSLGSTSVPRRLLLPRTTRVPADAAAPSCPSQDLGAPKRSHSRPPRPLPSSSSSGRPRR